MMETLHKVRPAMTAVLLIFLLCLQVSALPAHQELPEQGDVVISRLNSEERPVREAMELISDATRWQIFCSPEAGRQSLVMYTQNMYASDLFRSIIRSQGLLYRVEGNAIHVMTLREYNNAYGGAKEVFQLTYVSAERAEAALKPLLAASGAQLTALPEAAAIVVFDSPANIETLKQVIQQIDRPLETAVVRLHHSIAGDVATALQRFVSPMGAISADQNSNQVIISEVGGRLQSLVATVREMDLSQEKVTREFRLSNAQAPTVAQYLSDMFGLQTSAAAQAVVRAARTERTEAPPQQPTDRRGAAAARFREEMAQRGAQVAAIVGDAQSTAAVGTVVADVRTNSVWVTDMPERVEEIAKVVYGLDAKLETRTYRFNYADPQDMNIEDKLSGILPGEFDRYQIDARTRSLSITTTPERMEEVFELLKEWDRKPQQVFITGKVLAVNRDRLRAIGTSYNALIHQMDDRISTEVEVTGSFLPVIPATSRGSIRFGDVLQDNFTVLIQALESDSTTRLLSSPRVLVLDGQEAMFDVVTEEPYTEVVLDRDTGIALESVQFKRVGVSLGVAPKITNDDRISMLVSLEVSSLLEIRNGIPVVSTSQMSSNVLIDNGSPLVIGGLITDQDVNSVDKVPVLGDIPLFGGLFRSTRRDRSQHELILVIVPSIVGSAPYIDEPLISDIERDLMTAPYLEGERGEATTPAGAGVPSKGHGVPYAPDAP